MASWEPAEEEKLVRYLYERVTGRASGRLENECLFNMPRDRYFIGNLRSAYEENSNENVSSSFSELMRKLAPVAFGAEFLLKPTGSYIEIPTTIKWTCYYRVFPTFEQQSNFLNRITKEQNENKSVEKSEKKFEEKEEAQIQEDTYEHAQVREIENEKKEGNEERKSTREKRDDLCPRFKKMFCSANANLILFKSNDGNEWQIDVTQLLNALRTEISHAQQIIKKDPDTIRTSNRDIDKKIKIPPGASQSETDFQTAISSLKYFIIPEWEWTIESTIHPQGELLYFTLILTNTSPMPDKSYTRENFLFDTSIELIFNKIEICPFKLELAPKGFRYERHMWGKGFNCSVEKITETLYRTSNTPIYPQKWYNTRTEPEARFEDLAKDPIPILSKILAAMEDYNQKWQMFNKSYKKQFGNQWDDFEDEFLKDWNIFKDEIRLFKRGMELIKNNDLIRYAFQLTNETFRRAGDHPFKSEKKKYRWRLFQIVFLVNQIPGISALLTNEKQDILERELVDIIYFPTGGGKTEAYLSVLVFHCFFDRLRGKTAGVTAWTRFPLRLLTLQQTQRMADIIGIAELVRREQKDSRLNGPNIDGFAVGYFVGQEATPNKLTLSSQNNNDVVNWHKALDPKMRQNWKRIINCPSCRTSTVSVEFDETKVRIIHKCNNPNCAFPNGNLPVYVIDNEIYRNLPCVVAGTIDKLAGIGNERKFSLIFGQVSGKCDLHGYYHGKCCQPECKDTKLLKAYIPPGISGPTLFIQDELHLLREGLGTFDSHYETFVQKVLNQFGQNKSIKIIASSATIEAFERQVEHLYGKERRQARKFPGIGPSLEESFYAQTLDRIQRIFIGILPHNKTIFNAILELLQYYHEETQNLLSLQTSNPYNGALTPGTKEWNELIDNYLTSLTYFLAGRDLSSIRTDLEAAVNSELINNGFRELIIREMTGGTSTNEVTTTLEKVEKPHKCGKTPDVILATSMISHGVDVDRFNSMIFYGMPRQTAEYIQASSRVGRAHTGLVFTCLHPVRERDQSHYNYFVKYHEFLGQLVEPVALNRWSKFSVRRTLPGLFMGILLQLIANRSGESNPNRYYILDFVRQKINSGEITEKDFIPLLEEAYRVVHPANPAEQDFYEEIRRNIRMFLNQISNAGMQKTFVSDALYPKPMRSLRDVDEAIEIELDDIGSRWISRS